MKKMILAIAAFSFWGTTGMAGNTYAPQLSDVVVLQDVAEKDYSPFLFQQLMEDQLEMDMDPSCAHVRVQNDSLGQCVSKTGVVTTVGRLSGKTVGQVGFWSSQEVLWLDNVSIKETRGPRGEFIYSVALN